MNGRPIYQTDPVSGLNYAVGSISYDKSYGGKEMTCDTCIHRYVCRWVTDGPHPDCEYYEEETK